MKSGSVLVVEDDPAAARYLAVTLEEEFCKVRTATTGSEALLAMEAEVPDLAFLDLRLPDMDGRVLLGMMKEKWYGVPVVFVSAADDIPTVIEAVQQGAINYLVKPVAPATLLAASRRALATATTRRSISDSGIPEIVGVSNSIVRVRHLVTLAARSDVNVLITGPTGTGKELVARAIHRLSGLARGPFVAQNCSLTPPDLFESQFFGHRRGAFTGAERDHTGLLEECHGGTLFLDELECMSLAHQAKLLRVLDDGAVRPVGSNESHVVSVRFLAATNGDPAEMLAQGTLREDLYYRLRGVEIRLTPLNERREDIPLLVAHFLEESGHVLGPEALAALCALPWPGNVRELRNVIRHASGIAPNPRISLRELGLDFSALKAPGGQSPPKNPPFGGGCALKEIERQTILQALRDFQGNHSRAARALGIDRSTLRRKIRKLRINSSIRAP